MFWSIINILINNEYIDQQWIYWSIINILINNDQKKWNKCLDKSQRCGALLTIFYWEASNLLHHNVFIAKLQAYEFDKNILKVV